MSATAPPFAQTRALLSPRHPLRDCVYHDAETSDPVDAPAEGDRLYATTPDRSDPDRRRRHETGTCTGHLRRRSSGGPDAAFRIGGTDVAATPGADVLLPIVQADNGRRPFIPGFPACPDCNGILVPGPGGTRSGERDCPGCGSRFHDSRYDEGVDPYPA